MGSEHFLPREWKAFERVGDILIPGDDVLPKFSACGFYSHVDRLVGCLPKSDVTQLRLLLTVLGFLPNFIIRLILKLASLDGYFPGFLGVNLRKVSTGLRGIVFSLYYSFLEDTNGWGERIREGIDYDAAVRTKLEREDDLPGLIEAANPLNRRQPEAG